jgi:hypothetical protein
MACTITGEEVAADGSWALTSTDSCRDQPFSRPPFSAEFAAEVVATSSISVIFRSAFKIQNTLWDGSNDFDEMEFCHNDFFPNIPVYSQTTIASIRIRRSSIP